MFGIVPNTHLDNYQESDKIFEKQKPSDFYINRFSIELPHEDGESLGNLVDPEIIML